MSKEKRNNFWHVPDSPFHVCCFHTYFGPIWMVVPDGHVLEKCCKCPKTRTVHIDHKLPHRSWSGGRPYTKIRY